MGLVLATVALVASLMQPQAASAQERLDAATKQPQTLYASRTGTIAAFAQDGPLIAWFAPSSKGCNTVQLLSVANSGQVTLPDESPSARNVTCQWEVAPPVRLALAHTDAVWTLRDKLSPLPFDYVLGAGFEDTRERRYQEIAHAGHGAGLWLGGLAGDSTVVQAKTVSTLVYGLTAVGYVDEVACLSRNACAMKIDRPNGGVYRIVGRNEPTRIPGTSAAMSVAVSGTTVAYIPTASVADNGQPLASPDLPIEVRDSTTGTVVTEVVPNGTPVALALTPNILALLERTKSGLQISWYDAHTGTPTGSASVPATTSPSLTATNQLIVFRTGTTIKGVTVSSGKVTTLAHAAATPIGLSLEGTRLAWAENINGRGRVRALTVNGRG